MAKVGKIILTWDECEMAKVEVEYRTENWEDFFEEALSVEKIEEDLYQNTDWLEVAWDETKEYLSEILQKKNPDGYWKATVNNFGWRNQDGHKVFQADSGEDFLQEILPKTDCTFKVHNYGKGLAIQNWHHDSPTGNEWYHITPIAASTYDKDRGC